MVVVDERVDKEDVMEEEEKEVVEEEEETRTG